MQRGRASLTAGKRAHRRAAGARLCLLAAATLAWGGTSAARPAPSILPQAGATITVTTTQDEVIEDGNCSLREAVRAANLDAPVDACSAGNGADTILIPAGTFLLQIPGAGEDEALSGDLDIGQSVTLRGAGQDLTRVDGNGLDRVFEGLDEAVEVSIQSLTVAGGSANCGGGIYNRGTARITDALFTENSALVSLAPACGDGGAVYSSGTVITLRAVFDHNSAEERGGAIFAAGSLTLEASHLEENSAYDGGAVNLTGQGEILTSDLSYNRAMSGGGVFNLGTLRIEHTTLAYNQAQIETGGAIRQLGQLTLLNSSVRANTAWESGGGLSIGAGDTRIENSLLAGNETGEAGGGGLQQSGGTLTVLNTTFSGNHAALAGGGLELTGGEANLIHVTITENAAATNDPGEAAGGGGLSAGQGQLSIEHSLIGGNQDNSSETAIPDCSAAAGLVHSGGYNLVGQADGCAWNLAPGDLLGSIAEPLDLGLRPLSDLGGPTLVHGLLPGSPAIDLVISGACPATDQRGAPRPQDGNSDGVSTCDAGAFEAGPVETNPPPEPPAEIRFYLPLIAQP